MKWQSSKYPPDGTWCWVTAGGSVWAAVRDRHAAGGWTNEDTWEDWEGRVIAWKPLEMPDPPVVRNEAAGASIEFEAGLVPGRVMHDAQTLEEVCPRAIELPFEIQQPFGTRYRVTLTPVEPEPPSWDDTPEWAQWLAQTINGTWIWHAREPVAAQGYWSTRGNAKASFQTFPNPNWRDTLQQRPEPELPVESAGNAMTVTKHTDGMQVMVNNNANGRACADVTGGTITLNTVITSSGRWIRVSFEPDEPHPTPDPLCPVCGKPAGEHRDGLFCCGHCGGEVMLWAPVTAHMGWNAHCNRCKTRTTEHDSADDARAAWNRRA